VEEVSDDEFTRSRPEANNALLVGGFEVHLPAVLAAEAGA